MNESIVVRNTGTVSRRGRPNATLDMLKALLSNRDLQMLAKAGARNVREYVSKPSKAKSSKAGSTLVIKDVDLPVSKGFEMLRRGPNTTVTKGGGVRVRHRELLDSSLVASEDWSLAYAREFEINPGLSATFPWLSTIAKNYTEYRVHGLSFDYVPSCPTTTPGDVIMTPLYDPQIPTPNSEVQASDQIDTKVGSVFIPHKLVLKPSRMNITGSKKLVRDYAMAQSIVNYDCGRVCISTTSGPGTAVGKLFVTYDVELFAPRLTRPVTGTGWPTNYTQFVLSGSAVLASGTDYHLTTLLTQTLAEYNNLDITLSGNYFKAPYGLYRVRVQFYVYNSAVSTNTMSVAFGSTGCAEQPGILERYNTATAGYGKSFQTEFVWNNTPEAVGAVPNNLTIVVTATTSSGTLTLERMTGAGIQTIVSFWLL